MRPNHHGWEAAETFRSMGRKRLRESGMKVTPQRSAVLELIAQQPIHWTPQQVHSCLEERESSLSLATVYNTLEAFEAIGLLRRITMWDGQTYFDPNLAPHHHAVCDHCDEIFDLAIPRETLESLKRSTECYSTFDGDFQLEVATVWFRGSCADCRRDD